MDKKSLIYIAGHKGLIGSALMRQLTNDGYINIAVRPHEDLDLTDRKAAEEFFKENRPEYVFLCAAKTGGISVNNAYPADFIYENIMVQTNVIDLAYRFNVKKLLFLGCPCIYPKICPQPIKEEYLLSGHIEPTNEPYSIAKIAGIKMCQAYNRQYGTKFIVVIPPNIYGPNDHSDESAHVVSSLIRKFHEAKTGISPQKSVTVWGTGNPRREFLYADDAAQACIFLMNTYESNEMINIGGGCDTSITELAGLIKEITGFEGEIVYDKSKPDGMPQRLLDNNRISSLGWQSKTTLEQGLRLLYNWYKAQKST